MCFTRLTPLARWPVILGSNNARFLGQAWETKKVFMITESGGRGRDLQRGASVHPVPEVRGSRSRKKLLTGEINAAVDGLLEGGATEVVVWTGMMAAAPVRIGYPPKGTAAHGHAGLVNARAGFLLQRGGLHRAATPWQEAEKGVLSILYSSEGIQDIWVNTQAVGKSARV